MPEPFLGVPPSAQMSTSGDIGRAASELSRAAEALQASSSQMSSSLSRLAGSASGAMPAVGAAAFAGMAGTVGAPAFAAAGKSMASPFFGGGVSPQGPGQMMPTPFGSGARMMGMGSGFIDPRQTRQAGGGAMMTMAAERSSQLAGDRMMSMMGGAAGAVNVLGADFGISSAATSGLSRLGMGGIAAGIGGMAAGTGIGMLGSAAIDRTMRQAAATRALGQQVNQTAFRHMDPSTLGAGGRMSSRQQLDVGSRLARQGNEDLTFSQGDMQTMLQSMGENDLLRGARNSDQLVQKFRQAKQTIKVIAQNMGKSIQEAGAMAAELQGLGFNAGAPQGRAAIFGAGSVPGMTREESFRGAAGMAGQYRGAGISKQMFGMGMMSQQLGQGAIMSGGLNQEQIAQAGGREGVQQLMGRAMGGFVQSQTGMAVLAAGMKGGQFDISRVAGRNLDEILGQAGNAASRQNILKIKASPQEVMRQALKDPNQFASMAVSVAAQAAQRSLPDGSPEELQQATRAMMQQMFGLSAPESETMMNIVKSAPESMRMARAQGARSAGMSITGKVLEEASLAGTVNREVGRFFQGPAEGVAGIAAGAEAMTGRAQRTVRESLFGTRIRSMKAGDTLQLDKVDRSRIASAASSVRENRKVDRRTKNRAREVVTRNYRANRIKAHELADQVKDGTDPDAAKDLFALLSKDFNSGEPIPKHAIDEEISRRLGIPMHKLMDVEQVSAEKGEEAEKYGQGLERIFRRGQAGGGGASEKAEGGAAGYVAGLALAGPLGAIIGAGLGMTGGSPEDISGLSPEGMRELGRDEIFQEYAKSLGTDREKEAYNALEEHLGKRGMEGARIMTAIEKAVSAPGGRDQFKKIVTGFERTQSAFTRQAGNLGLQSGMRKALSSNVEGLELLRGAVMAGGEIGADAFKLELGKLELDELEKKLGATEGGRKFMETEAGKQLLSSVGEITTESTAEQLEKLGFRGDDIKEFMRDGLDASEVGTLRQAKMRGIGLDGAVTTGKELSEATLDIMSKQSQTLTHLDRSISDLAKALDKLGPIIQGASPKTGVGQ